MVKKCFFLLDSLSVGGSERKTVRVANKLVERGEHVQLGFLNADSDLRQSIDPRIPVFSGRRKGKFDIFLLKEIRRYIDEQDINIAWGVNLYPLLYLFLATRGFRRKVRVIGSSNITVFRNTYEIRKMRLYAPIIRRLDGFVFGSYRQKSLWENKYRLSGGNLGVIYNGVDTNWFSAAAPGLDRIAARKIYGFDDLDIVIGMVAQFRVEKAHGDLLAACSILSQRDFPVKLLLVGSGGEEVNIRNRAKELGITDKVIFTGQLDDVRPALAAMDIFALTSRSVETFSNAALEAMAMGLPAVLSDLSGASEMVNDRENGSIYTPGDVDALVQALESLLDVETRQNYGRRAREIVEKRFSIETMADQYLQIIWEEYRLPN